VIDSSKKAFYAAIGAPVVVAKRASEAFDGMADRVKGMSDSFTDDIRSEFASWTAEGEKVMNRVSSQPVVEDLTARIDLDGQVGKLREQLDDLLESWRKNFRPGDVAEKIEVEATPAAKPAAKKPAPKKPAAKKPAAKKSAAKKPAAKKPAAKTSTARKPASKVSA